MMNEIIEKFRNVKNIKELRIIIVAVVAVIVLLVIVTGGGNESAVINETEETTNKQSSDMNETEEQLEQIIGRIAGVGNVSVMITFRTSGEYVYAENSKSENNGDRSSFDSEVVLYETENGNNEGLVVSVKNPEISGVAVVCDGGERIEIKAEITDLVTSLFGIGADRVYVGSNAP